MSVKTNFMQPVNFSMYPRSFIHNISYLLTSLFSPIVTSVAGATVPQLGVTSGG
jgi:hypothetical protein